MSSPEMMTLSMARHAIRASVLENRIVNLVGSEDVMSAIAGHLLTLSDDNVESDGVREYWGVDDDGNEWRVHVAKEVLP